MINYYVRSGIDILNDTTKDLQKLDELGIYLAKQTNVNALKSLKLLILASANSLLDKDFDIDSVKSYTKTFMGESYPRNESIIGNLSMNPQHIGLELMEYILANYEVDLSVQPYDSGYGIVDLWLRSFVRIENNQDIFYKRYDMIDKKLDIIQLMIQDDLLDINQIDFLLTIFERCLQRKYSYTKEQLLRMHKIFNIVRLKDRLEINTQKVIEEALWADEQSCVDKKDFRSELQSYEMFNDQCCYMLETIPVLIKNKIIQ